MLETITCAAGFIEDTFCVIAYQSYKAVKLRRVGFACIVTDVPVVVGREVKFDSGLRRDNFGHSRQEILVIGLVPCMFGRDRVELVKSTAHFVDGFEYSISRFGWRHSASVQRWSPGQDHGVSSDYGA